MNTVYALIPARKDAARYKRLSRFTGCVLQHDARALQLRDRLGPGQGLVRRLAPVLRERDRAVREHGRMRRALEGQSEILGRLPPLLHAMDALLRQLLADGGSRLTEDELRLVCDCMNATTEFGFHCSKEQRALQAAEALQAEAERLYDAGERPK